jgi:hypothetical protein
MGWWWDEGKQRRRGVDCPGYKIPWFYSGLGNQLAAVFFVMAVIDHARLNPPGVAKLRCLVSRQDCRSVVLRLASDLTSPRSTAASDELET